MKFKVKRKSEKIYKTIDINENNDKIDFVFHEVIQQNKR